MKSIIVFLCLLAGNLMASPSPLIDETKYKKFLQKINYQHLLKNPPPERQLNIHWKKELGELTSVDNLPWKIKHFSESITDKGQDIFANLLLDNKIIILNIETIKGNWQERLDKMVYKLTLTNTVEVYGDLVESKADLHIRRHHASHILVGQYALNLSTWDEISDAEFFNLENKIIAMMTDH